MEYTKIIETTTGKLRGYKDSNIELYKGIPYCERMIGELRFKPPVSKKPWPGVLEATEFGPICPQVIPPMLLLPPSPQSEPDCLTLNIWTPSTDDQKRPVMVWIHGGGFSSGSGRAYNGEYLVKRGNVVVVTINYRLNFLGFTYIEDKTTNVGILDQIAALKWIQDNINLFGGDPKNVTIFGESAGAMAVSTLLAIPRAKGLFKRVIAQSGACNPLSYSSAEGKKATDKLMEEFRFKNGDLQSLSRISAYEFLKLLMVLPGPNPVPWPITIPPFIDKDIIPKHPLDFIKNGEARNVDLLIGTNLNEAKLWKSFMPGFIEANQETLVTRIKEILKHLEKPEEMAEKIIETYKKNKDLEKIKLSDEKLTSKTPQDILDAFSTDLQFRIAAIRTAEAQAEYNSNTYMYLFTFPSPFFNGTLGSCHITEIPFVFGMLDDPRWTIWSGSSKEGKMLSEKVMDAWIAFAHTGNPNHKGIPEWPKYNKEKRVTMVLNKEIKAVEKPLEARRIIWKDII
ncbi:MAG: carboxylesterase/lipase family protein [Promethearchaeota archaeon]